MCKQVQEVLRQLRVERDEGCRGWAVAIVSAACARTHTRTHNTRNRDVTHPERTHTRTHTPVLLTARQVQSVATAANAVVEVVAVAWGRRICGLKLAL